MERLTVKQTNELDRIFKKLESSIVNKKVTKKELAEFQRVVDKLDNNSHEPNFKLYELQSLIYFANHDNDKAQDFIEDALSLNDNLEEYSTLGALLAETYLKNNSRSSNSVSDIDNTHSLKGNSNKPTRNEKKFNGKFEGWLALYTLRLVLLPIVLLIDAATVFSLDSSNLAGEIQAYLISALIFDVVAAIFVTYTLYVYFKKRRETILLIQILESVSAATFFIFGIWLFLLSNGYATADTESEVGKLFTYSIASILWLLYWLRSKRVADTFERADSD